jgi:hypothetical protein
MQGPCVTPLPLQQLPEQTSIAKLHLRPGGWGYMLAVCFVCVGCLLM